jgi:6-phosphofructokinase 2
MSAAVVTITLNPCIDKTFAVDRIIPDRKLSCTRVRSYPGGGGINVARTIIQLGGDTLALWSCGGPVGKQLARMLDDEKVAHVPIRITGETRENLIAKDTSCEQQYRFGMPGPQLRDAELDRWREAVLDHAPRADYLVMSGSLPPGASPDWLGDLIRALPPETHAIVDTKKAGLERALDAGVYLIKPNIDELQDLIQQELTGDDDIEQAAREIIERDGARVVLVSLGGAGAMLVTARGCEHIAAPTVPRRSRVGAGDSTIGGLCKALADGRPIDEAARFGVAAGAASVMTPGTELARREDTERLYRRMQQAKR